MKTKYSRREFGRGCALLGSGLMALEHSHAAFGSDLHLQLERGYPRSALLALSPDGTKVALAVSGQPFDTFRFLGGRWAAGSDKLAPDLLKVVELRTGSVVYEEPFRARVFPASFFADGLRIYAETVPFKEKGRTVNQFAVINLSTGERQDQLIPADSERTTGLHALHDDLLLVQVRDGTIKRAVSLAEVAWPRIETKFQVEYATTARESNGHDFEKYLSADRGTLVYAFDHTIVCRRTEDLKVLWTREVESEYFGAWRFLLIRLFQQATTGSMSPCLVRDFRKVCGSFNRSLLPKKHASGIWAPAVGRMASCVRSVETDGPMNWRTSDDGSVPAAGARFP